MNEKRKTARIATFAGGCFWCVESDFEKVNGVVEVISGYAGGHKEDPTYKEVSSGTTGHAEAVQVLYDPAEVTYEELLDVFWRHVDPTDPGGQFVDRGLQYQTVIFYHNDEQKRLSEESKETKICSEKGPLDKVGEGQIKGCKELPYNCFLCRHAWRRPCCELPEAYSWK